MRDPEKWRLPLQTRIRWWNLALGVVILGGAAAVVVPLRNPAYRVGFSGNLVSSVWQLILGGAVAWIVFKRFKAERFKTAMSISWDNPFQEMHNISLALYPIAIGEAADLRTALNIEIRKRHCEAVTSANRKATLYGRFFEIEQLVDIDRSCDAAEGLAALDNLLPDPEFMRDAIGNICELYAWTSSVLGYRPSRIIVDELHGASKKWLTLARAVE
jgi:hypothetical protein